MPTNNHTTQETNQIIEINNLNQIPQLEYDLSTFVFILVAMMSISPLLFGPVGFFDNPYTGEMELFLIFAISISIFYVID
jgi:hypothetical protein